MKKALLGAALAFSCLDCARAAAQSSLEAEGVDVAASELETPGDAESAARVAEAAKQARAHFIEGTRSARAGRWTEALAAYQAAYRLYPHATTLYNIGFCQMQRGELVAAWRSTERALASDAHELVRQMSPERRAVAEQQRVALKQRLPILIVRGPAGLLVRIDDLPLQAVQGEAEAFTQDSSNDDESVRTVAPQTRVYVDPGEHTVELAFGGALQRQTVALGEGAELTVEWRAMEAKRARSDAVAQAPDPIRATRPVAPVNTEARSHERSTSLVQTAKVGSFAIAAGGFGLALTSGIVAWSTGAKLDSACPTPRTCPASAQGRVERYRRAIELTNVGLIAGVAGSALGVGLVLWGRDSGKRSTTALLATPDGLQLAGEL